MKKNSGFSLVEILAIIVIIGIITAISVPNIKKLIDKEDEATENTLNRKIENAAHLYAAKYYADKIVDANPFSFNLTDLKKDGLLQLNDDECGGALDKIISYNGKYDYSLISDANNISGCFKCKVKGDCKRQ